MNTILVLMTVSWMAFQSANHDQRTGGFAVLTTKETCERAVGQTQRFRPLSGNVTVSCAPYNGKAAEVVKP